MYNNIFAGPSNILDSGTAPVTTGSNNWFERGTSVPVGVTYSLFGEIDPMFVNPLAGDYRLMPNSLCRDGGYANPMWFTPQFAWQPILPANEPLLFPAPRPIDAAIDLGGYETATALPATGGPGDCQFQ